MMKQYRVTWELDIYADTPIQAAKTALRIQRDAGSSATVFDVQLWNAPAHPVCRGNCVYTVDLIAKKPIATCKVCGKTYKPEHKGHTK